MIKNKILFVSALLQESQVIKKNIAGKSFLGYKIDFFVGGVGNYNMIFNLTEYTNSHHDIAFIVNIGVCGKKVENEGLVQIYKIKNQSSGKESLPPVYFQFAELESILCSEKVLTHPDELGEYNYVDMESYAIDFVCAKKNIPHIILKQPFDMVSQDSLAVCISQLQKSLENIDVIKLIENICIFLDQNQKKEIDTQYFEKKHRLTFSQGLFLKKFIQKKIAFGVSLQTVWGQLEALEKKEFLIEIKS